MEKEQKKILIIEDEKPMARAMELKLNNSGFITTVVHDGESALKMLASKSFDLAVLDLMIPKKDGFEVLAEIKNQGNTTPIIVASNLSQDEDIQRTRTLGAIGYFVKSNTSLVTLVETIKDALNESH